MFLDSDDYLYDKYTLEKILKKFKKGGHKNEK